MALTIEGRSLSTPPAAVPPVGQPSAAVATPSTSTSTTTTTTSSPESVFARLLHAVGSEIDRGEGAVGAAIRGARGGRDVSTVELIALQAQIYRYVEVVDLASKLVDRAGNGLRTLLQGQ